MMHTEMLRLASSGTSISEPHELEDAASIAASTIACPSCSVLRYAPAHPRRRPIPRVDLIRTSAPVRL
jgi:hypothetical protein